MPVLETKGAASAQGFGLTIGGAGEATYIEDVFSTYLYTGNGSTQTITNGIDLAGEGGLVWLKNRTTTGGNTIYDTARGASGGYISANTTSAQSGSAQSFAFNSDGFTAGSINNSSPYNYASWTFRKAPKFFDVVTWTGNNVQGRAISHNLGSVPGVVIIKKTNGAEDWVVYHRSVGAGLFLKLNTTGSQFTSSAVFPTVPTDSVFYVGNDSAVNGTLSDTYVAYLFAHDAGGFGLSGTDNVISCGSYAGTGSSTVSISLGYEPQWVLIKKFSGSTFTDGSASWCIFDNMRGIPTGGSDACLYANLSGAENSEGAGNFINVTATGFEVPPTGNLTNQSACSYIYIAIRRGPMKVPTDGTEVFTPQATRTASNGTPSQNSFTSNFPMDMMIQGFRDGDGATAAQFTLDRLRGSSPWLATTTTGTENANTTYSFASQTGIYPTTSLGATNMCGWMFRRAPGFFDEVCYTGNGGSGTRAIDHNLRVPPELLIVKSRSNSATEWVVGNTVTSWPNRLALNNTTASSASDIFSDTPPSSLVFNVRRASGDVNETGWTFVAYLFASCPGVSKVGSYTGTGATQVINCGFTGGARFVLIKATSTTGNWLVWDSARGIVAGNDPYLALNSTAAEVTNTDWVDTAASGFELSNAGGNLANSNGVSYIYLAIA